MTSISNKEILIKICELTGVDNLMEVEAERLAPGHLLLVNRELRQRANALQVRLSIIQRAYNHYTKKIGEHQKDTESLCCEIEIALKNYKREAIR